MGCLKLPYHFPEKHHLKVVHKNFCDSDLPPITIFQPWQSPYTSMDNDPINLNDVMGLDPKYDANAKEGDVQVVETSIKNEDGSPHKEYWVFNKGNWVYTSKEVHESYQKKKSEMAANGNDNYSIEDHIKAEYGDKAGNEYLSMALFVVSNSSLKPTSASKQFNEQRTAKTQSVQLKTNATEYRATDTPFQTQYDKKYGTKAQQDVSCCKASKEMIEKAGYTPGNSGNRIDVTTFIKGKLTKTSDYNKGINKLDELLAAGKPVQVGVSKSGRGASGNHNKATHHFVTVVAKLYDSEKKQHYYLFQEPGTGRSAMGTSALNRLYIGADGVKGSTAYSSKWTYTLSEVRPTQ